MTGNARTKDKRVTTIRLEDVDTNYTGAIGTLFDAILPPLRLHATNVSADVLRRALMDVTSRFDLSRNAPAPDKTVHVSRKDDKQELRAILMGHPTLRPLITSLRQALDYDHPSDGAPAALQAIDLKHLNAAISAAIAAQQLAWHDNQN